MIPTDIHTLSEDMRTGLFKIRNRDDFSPISSKIEYLETPVAFRIHMSERTFIPLFLLDRVSEYLLSHQDNKHDILCPLIEYSTKNVQSEGTSVVRSIFKTNSGIGRISVKNEPKYLVASGVLFELGFNPIFVSGFETTIENNKVKLLTPVLKVSPELFVSGNTTYKTIVNKVLPYVGCANRFTFQIITTLKTSSPSISAPKILVENLRNSIIRPQIHSVNDFSTNINKIVHDSSTVF